MNKKGDIKSIKHIFDSLTKDLIDTFHDNFKCLLLYGSWAKGTEREDSDIDLLAIFEKIDAGTSKSVFEIEMKVAFEKTITIVSASIEDFHKESIPLYTAIKKEGKILWGNIDLNFNNEEPYIKYKEAFERSKAFEMGKIKMAEDILKDYPRYGDADLCFIASKHAIQMALAMKGVGYSSKVSILQPLAEKFIGKEVAENFKMLFNLYIKSGYGIEHLTEEESWLTIEYAKKITGVCYCID